MVDMNEGFRFSQSILQDFLDCRRRFRLRYIDRQLWPAVESEPFMENERLLDFGQRFHRIVYQFFMGVPEEDLRGMIKEHELEIWWSNFYKFAQRMKGAGRWEESAKFVEYVLSAPMGEYRLVAKYDLILITPAGKVQIYDWKTSQRRPRREWLHGRMQTIVYPFLLLHANIPLPDSLEIRAENIQLIYWFSNFPDQSEVFGYSEERYQNDMKNIQGIVSLIKNLEYSDFSKTSNLERCQFCEFRSLCDRGKEAGTHYEFDLSDPEGMSEYEYDLEQIGEIKY